jgi:hypothetical protein
MMRMFRCCVYKNAREKEDAWWIFVNFEWGRERVVNQGRNRQQVGRGRDEDTDGNRKKDGTENRAYQQS